MNTVSGHIKAQTSVSADGLKSLLNGRIVQLKVDGAITARYPLIGTCINREVHSRPLKQVQKYLRNINTVIFFRERLSQLTVNLLLLGDDHDVFARNVPGNACLPTQFLQ